MIDILLGSDNAVVIALTSGRLPEAQHKQAIFRGYVRRDCFTSALDFLCLAKAQSAVVKHSIKYRYGRGNTWSGCGKTPRWLAEIEKAGAKPDHFS